MTRHMGWDTALDAQTDLLRSFTTRPGRRYLDGFAESLTRSGMIDPNSGERMGANPDHAHELINASTFTLAQADPMFVSAELAELINYAADSPTYRPEPIVETDLIVPAGFAYFEKPLEVMDTNGNTMYHRAVQWCVTGYHSDDPTARPQFSIVEEATGMTVTGILLAMYSHRDDPDHYHDAAGEKMDKIGGSDLTLAHVTTFRFNDPRLATMTDPSLQALFRHIAVFFRLCQQTIAVSHQQRVSRPTWKRAAAWRQIKSVVVFTLRRAKDTVYEGEEREVEWSHRWMVGAHWRNQPYKAPDGSTYYRQIWIAPYVKGPANKPLVLKRRAFELVR